MAPFEVLYGRKCRTPLCWDEVGERKLLDLEYVQITAEKVKIIKEKFGKRGKLSPRYIGPYEIVERIGPVAYRLDLPTELSRIHDVFHVSMLRKYILDPSHVLESQLVELKENLTYAGKSVQILDRKEHVLRNKTIPLVKVLWRNHAIEEATWESEEQMRSQYLQIFRT
ncbi:uncharacterized protein LOC111385521 [Olea europaea var. sylvestris]|uniref:uncharacterized protein LOC111385521 n=1 Tax=Olea europaea var. sylvestris TaxID=158386 RepID=UPI000C1D6A70|nr:uncharacterized protein LOC111385521 [Olea europaea var. sylvestris]